MTGHNGLAIRKEPNVANSRTYDEKAAFNEFDTELNLDPDERKKAQDIHKEITELLRKAGIIVYAFLQGSLARKTMIKPLRDIDKCVILPAYLWDQLNGLGGTDLVMDWIEECLRLEYGARVAFDRSKHALKVTFAAESFTFDIVPAFETNDDSDDVLIANRTTNIWEPSNTRELIRIVQVRNGLTAGKFIHQARLGKHLVRNLIDGNLPGLHVESLAYTVIAEPLEHPVAMERLLSQGARILCGDYCDPTGRDIISRKLKPGVQEQARACFTSAASRAAEARRLAEAGDHLGAIEIWASLFGEPFPAPVSQTVDAAFANSFAGGSITSAGRVSATLAGHQPSRPTRSWRLL
jgi:hypothetical protein